MALDQTRVREHARSYTDAWCSHDPARVAAHFASGGTIAINGGEPTEVTEVARSFISAFPDIQVFMDDVVFKDETVEYHWTFTGTNTGPGERESRCGSPASKNGCSVTTVSSSSRKATTTKTSTRASSSTERPSHSGRVSPGQ